MTKNEAKTELDPRVVGSVVGEVVGGIVVGASVDGGFVGALVGSKGLKKRSISPRLLLIHSICVLDRATIETTSFEVIISAGTSKLKTSFIFSN